MRYNCTKCHKKFNHQGSWYNHTKLTCGTGTTYFCPYCNHTSKYLKNLPLHVKAKHDVSSRHWEVQFSRRRDQYEHKRDFERRPLPAYYSHQRETQLPGERRGYTVRNVATVQRKTTEFNSAPYLKPVTKPIPQKIFQERNQFNTAKPISSENATVVKKTQHFVAPAAPKFDSKPVFPRPADSNPSAEPKKPADQKENISKKREPFQLSSYSEFEENSFQEPSPITTKHLPPNESANTAKNYKEIENPSRLKSFNKPLQKPVEEQPLFSSTKPTPTQGSGLLTDSLSCIFTRRPQKNTQHKIPQKRVFFEEVPANEKEDPPSDSESTYLTEKKTDYDTPEKQCPQPPIISQATPNISNEDWFATKQRILSSVNRDPPLKGICEPQPVRENKCPEPPQLSVDPHGFDIEPPEHLNKNVSPYVPTNSCERDEYNKYKNQQFKKEAALLLAQKRYKEGFEAPSAKKEPPTSYLKDNQRQEKIDASSYKELSNYQQYPKYESQPAPIQEEISAYEPKTTVTDSHRQPMTYEPSQRYDHQLQIRQNEQEYDYQRNSYNTVSYEEQARTYENVPPEYHTESSAYYGQQNTYEHGSYNEPENLREMYTAETAPQTNYEGQNELENLCPEAPNISEDSQMIKDEPHESLENSPPEAPVISENNAPSYYQDENYGDYATFEDQNRFIEPSSVATSQAVGAGNQQMCHRCSFQTTNAKKLRDHLKFVHGETTPEISPSSTRSNELFSRRLPKPPEGQTDLFYRRETQNEDLGPEGNQQNLSQGRFKRRNTAAVVNIISTNILVPARKEIVEDNAGEVGHEGEQVQVQTQESGVLAAMEYFETTKDQPKKPRPYRRNQDDTLDDDWI